MVDDVGEIQFNGVEYTKEFRNQRGSYAKILSNKDNVYIRFDFSFKNLGPVKNTETARNIISGRAICDDRYNYESETFAENMDSWNSFFI